MSRDTALRQGRRYRMKDHGHSEQAARRGNFILKSEHQASVDYYKPNWEGGHTTIRIYPSRDEAGTGWEPFRYSTDPRDTGDWIRRYPAIRNYGEDRVTCIIADPAEEHQGLPALPAWELYNAIKRAIANRQDPGGWAGRLQGGQGQSAELSRPTEIYLVQCCIVYHKTTTFPVPKGLGANDKPVLMELSTSSGLALLNQINLLKEGYSGADDDWEAMYVNGDPISLDYGRFVTFYNLAGGDPRARQQQQQSGWDVNQQAGGSGDRAPIGYGCYLEPTFNGVSANFRQYEQAVESKVLPWDDILHFPSPEEQAGYIAAQFPADMIMYAWQDFPEWIPEAVRSRAVNSVSAPSAGIPAPPGPVPTPPAASPDVVPQFTVPASTPPVPQAGAVAPTVPGWGGEAAATDGAATSQTDPAAMAWGQQANPAAPAAPEAHGATPVVTPALQTGGGIPAAPVPPTAAVVPVPTVGAPAPPVPSVPAAPAAPTGAAEFTPPPVQAADPADGPTRAQAALAAAQAARVNPGS